jgi:ligand-binding sensor domain-containing protein
VSRCSPTRAVALALAQGCVYALASASAPLPAAAETRLFIRNHIHSDQISGLVEWRGSLVAATLGGILFADPETGASTKILSAPGGLPSNRILCLAVSPSGTLWAGTADRGIARLKPGGGFQRTLTSFDGLLSDRVQALYVHGDSIWVGTSGGVALFTENPATAQTALRRSDSSASTARGLISDDVLTFLEVADTLWCGTGAGVSTFVNGTWLNRGAALSLATRSLTFHEDTLWAATPTGPRRYESGIFQPAASGHPGGSGVVYSDGARLLSGGVIEGAFRYQSGTWSLFGISSPGGFRPQAFLTTSNGALWAGTDQGLARYDPGSNAWTRIRAAGPQVNGSQRGVADDRGVWFSTGNFAPPGGALGNVLHYDGSVWTDLTNGSTGGGLQAASVFAILSDATQKLWFGHCCGGGDPKPRTDRFDPGTGLWEVLDATNLYALKQAPSGLVYGGSVEFGNGVYVFDPSTGAVLDSLTPQNTQGATGSGLASNNLRGIAFDPAGRGWFAHAAAGLDIWNGAGTVTNHADDVWVRLGTFFPSLQTTAVVTTGVSSGWVGTTAGLVRIRNDSVDRTATAIVNSALPSLQVHDLALDAGGHLWVATALGLARVDAQSQAVESWTTADGLAGNDVRSLVWDPKRGELWAGTTEGFSEILPSAAGSSGFGDQTYVYPSPLDPSSTTLRLGGITADVEGEIRDLTGALIRRFHCDPLRNEAWDLKLPNGSPAASGLYLVLLRDGDQSKVLRVAVIR